MPGQLQKCSYYLPHRLIQPLKQTVCFARDHPTPVQVYIFPVRLPREFGKAADDEFIHTPPPFLLPKIMSERTSEENRACL